MKFPKLNELNTSRMMIDVFKGYNHNLRIGDGEFYDMTNLTSSNYPVLSPRPKRGEYKIKDAEGNETPIVNPQGLISKNALCHIDNGTLYINGSPIIDSKMALGVKCETCPNSGGCSKRATEGDTTFCEKALISMGAYIIIMPDKKYINTEDLTDCGNIEASIETQEGSTPVIFELCKLDGDGYKDEEGKDIDISYIAKPNAPTDPKNLDLWIDTSSTPHVLKQYSKANEQWVSIATTYIKITYPGIGEPFNEGDGVTISGITISQLKDLNDMPTIIWAKGDNYIVITGIIDDGLETQLSPIKIIRKMPNMDFIIESENRLWGCRYGTAVNGEVVNEIYASKLGDFKNWNCFAGISTDSYVASVGTDGQFTGAITHLGYPIFFKENCMHKVYGNYPANYQIQTTTCRGVQKGCPKSLAIVNEVLYYKSRSAVCSYDGSLPVEISMALGDESYSNAVAGQLGNKYYISMLDSNEQHHLFVYDTKKGMWHREDDTHAIDFCTCRGDLYYIAKGKIKSVLGSGDKEKSNVNWMAETGIIGTDSPDKKYISRIDIRMSIDVGTYVYFYIQYDSSEEWKHTYTMAGHTLRSFSVPIRPKRCDHLRLRIEGEGEAKIYSICKTIEQGSDI